MKILIGAAGSHGDMLPCIALGQQFQQRGHEVCLYSFAPFESLARQAGIRFRSFGTNEMYQSLLRDPNINHSVRFWRKLAPVYATLVRPGYEMMAADVVPGNTIIVGTTLAFAARSVAEMHRVPVATVHFSPLILRSSYRLPRGTAMPPWQGSPRFLKRLQWYLADKLLIDPSMGVVVNRHRVELGLPPVRRFLHDWVHQSDAVVGMFPEWFAERQPDWPDKLLLTGFPLYDGHSPSLPPEVEAFVAQGELPIAFTAGTASATARDFYAVSAEACRRSGRRGILLTPHVDQIPHPLPSGVARFDYVPFRTLLPRVAALVHHGGIGTMSQAFRAGVPQLVRPMAHDQFDNSDRARRLGVAIELLPKHYRVESVVSTIDRLTGDRTIRERCSRLAQQVDDDGLSKDCAHILQALGSAASPF